MTRWKELLTELVFLDVSGSFECGEVYCSTHLKICVTHADLENSDVIQYEQHAKKYWWLSETAAIKNN